MTADRDVLYGHDSDLPPIPQETSTEQYKRDAISIWTIWPIVRQVLSFSQFITDRQWISRDEKKIYESREVADINYTIQTPIHIRLFKTTGVGK